MTARNIFKRILVKVGTSVITSKNRRLDKKRAASLVFQIAEVMDRGIEVVVVTSGAIGAGMGVLKKPVRPQSLPELQACAAIGQNRLMKMYGEFFKKRGYVIAQILLTQDDMTDRKRYLNAKNTILTLLKEGVVPIINENDTVSTEEIRFGDNDRLSSLTGNLLRVDLLIILSDVEGLCEYDKKTGKKIRCVGIVEKVTRDIENLALNQKSASGVGGMVSKLQAAKIATSSGVPCVIANGNAKGVLLKILERERTGTLFLASRDTINAKRHWIAYTSRLRGAIKVDSGAKEALIKRQKSLLSSGVIEGSGKFEAGDTVSVVGADGEEFARGLSNYSWLELKRIKGLQTAQIKGVLGYKYYDEVIHRDNLVIL